MGSSGAENVESVFTENVVPQAPEDPLFGLMAAYRKDTSDKKVDLGIGAYRDNNAKPWVLPVVKKVGLAIQYWTKRYTTNSNNDRPTISFDKIQI